MDEGLRRSAWITLGLAVAAHALVNHPAQSVLAVVVLAGIWMLRGRLSGALSGRLRDLPDAALGAVFCRHAASSSGPAAQPTPAGNGAGGGAPPSANRAEELSRRLRELCRSEAEARQADGARRTGDAPAATFPARSEDSGSGLSPAPDYAGAVIGYREWLFIPYVRNGFGFAGPPTALYSLTQQQVTPARGGPVIRRHQEWPLDRAHEAGCGRPVGPGSSGVPCRGFEACVCGFYAWHEAERIEMGGQGYATEPCYRVPGVIAGWGRVSLHESGFRCQRARIAGLLEPEAIPFYGSGDSGAARRAYAELIRRSGVPTLSWRELRDPNLARRLGLLKPRKLARGERG